MTLENIKNTQEEINNRLGQIMNELHSLREIISKDVPNPRDFIIDPEITGEGLLKEIIRAQHRTQYLISNLNILKEDLYDLTIEPNKGIAIN